jgi:restriction system protein
MQNLSSDELDSVLDVALLREWCELNSARLMVQLDQDRKVGKALATAYLPALDLRRLTRREALSWMINYLGSIEFKTRVEEQNFVAALEAKVAQHIKPLCRKYRSLTEFDDYGDCDTTRWFAEVRKFLKSTNLDLLPEVILPGTIDAMVTHIIEEHLRKTQENTELYDLVDPIGFEHSCAESLRAGGWLARTTKASGDQGADVLAEKHGVSIVVQCKLYSQPVGNKAVQEINAAKTFYKAAYGVVVSNAEFTSSARSLARSCGVRLSHYSELKSVCDTLGPGA